VHHRYFEDKFATAGVVFSSPLTRALQTAMLGLEGHRATSTDGITCLRSARELKGLGCVQWLSRTLYSAVLLGREMDE
jgi:hypothetical protein